MSAESAIEKLQQIAREKEVQRNEHRQMQEEEAELLKKTEVEDELRKAEKKLLNILSLVIRSPSHSSSFSECAERKAYDEKIQFVQTIIQNINTIRTSIIESLRKSR